MKVVLISISAILIKGVSKLPALEKRIEVFKKRGYTLEQLQSIKWTNYGACLAFPLSYPTCGGVQQMFYRYKY